MNRNMLRFCIIGATVWIGSCRTVNIDIKAPWHSHSLSFISEFSEFLFDQSPDHFFKYVNSMCSHTEKVETVLSSLDTDLIGELQSVAFETAVDSTPKAFHSLMDTMVGLGHYLPAVQFHQSLSEKFGQPCNGQSFAVFYPGEIIICGTETTTEATALFASRDDSKVDLVTAANTEWEHIYRVNSTDDDTTSPTNTPTTAVEKKVVLYGMIGTESFCKLHATLSAAAVETPDLQYSVRHKLPTTSAATSPTTTATVRLQGYGVFLDIKNMEYKNVDDEQKDKYDKDVETKSDDANNEDKPVTFAPDTEVMGINFHTLAASLPQHTSALHSLYSELLQQESLTGTSGEGDIDSLKLKIWKIKDLALQTMQAIASTNIQNTVLHAMNKFTEIVQNFPRMASYVSTVKVSPQLKAEVDALYGTGILMQLPQNSLFVNGKRFDLSANTFNVFDVLSKIKEELILQDKIRSLPVDKSIRKQLVSIATNIDKGASKDTIAALAQFGTINRIDVSKGGKYVVRFLNNLEKDEQYKAWPKSLKQLLYPSWSLHQVAKNMYTLISVLDVTTIEGAQLAMQMSMLIQQYPIRFGVVLACVDVDSAVSKTADSHELATSTNTPIAASDVNRLYAHLLAHHDASYATSFLFAIAEHVLQSQQSGQVMDENGDLVDSGDAKKTALSTDEVIELYVNTVATLSGSWSSSGYKTEAQNVLANKTMHIDFIHNVTQYLDARGVPVNSYSLNGIVSVDINMQQGLMQIIGREQYILGQYYQARVITDKTKSIFNAIMDHTGAHTRYHSMLDEKEVVYVDFNTLSGEALLLSDPTRSSHVDLFMSPVTTAEVEDRDADEVKLTNSTVLIAPLNKSGYQAATTAIEWLLHGYDVKQNALASSNDTSTSSLNSDNHRLAIIHTFNTATPSTASTDQTCSATDPTCTNTDTDLTTTSTNSIQDVLYLLHVVKRVTAVKYLVRDTEVKECGYECLKTLVLVYRLLETDHTISQIVAEVVTYLRTVCTASSVPLTTDFELDKTIAALKQISDKAVSEYGMQLTYKKAVKLQSLSLTLLRDSESSTSSTTTSNNIDEIVMVYNARKLSIPVVKDKRPLHELDITLLATLEQNRLTSSLTDLMDSVIAYSSTLTTFPAMPNTYSDILLRLNSYCGRYNAIGGKRYDMDSILNALAPTLNADGSTSQSSASSSLSFDSLFYSLEPDAAEYFGGVASNLKIFYLVDPLSLSGQRAASLLTLFRDHLHYSQSVLFTPQIDLSAFPLQNFYRYVYAPHDAGKAQASFTNLPRQHVLTVRVDIPEPWNVQAATASQDIDNLRCIGKVCGDPVSSDLTTAASAGNRESDLTSVSYSLKNLLVAGQCFQSVPEDATGLRMGLPPNGLQLTLTPLQSYLSHTTAPHSDTLVMQNLGYFQLQANPGLYLLSLAEGRATDLYTIKGADPSTHHGKLIAVRSFGDKIHRLVVNKRAGKEHIPLLETDDSEDAMDWRRQGRDRAAAAGTAGGGDSGSGGGMWDSLKSSLFGSSDKDDSASSNKVVTSSTNATEDNTIHIFSLATGHMYERLLRIMMLSVTRHSSRPVKFWLFENYLSPTFKQMAAVMAKEYGFEVAYVTYKWPQWLTQQTQQQRIIWGYKILFLDVLFPLNVKKVIYVDADQVVRADLAELWDLDLHGKPYGYTPFCTSREETLGFQFWRQGYWKDHLQGKPYHISALYVVDLQKFRKHAVGDSLRSVYDALSRDPNSLANLDQDLPNYAQHQVPIHSLPQEWLWCETWCSDKSKSKAKTIDLCNNPLHKEPKLDMARRVISGPLFNQSWVSLDDEIRALEQKQGFMQTLLD